MGEANLASSQEDHYIYLEVLSLWVMEVFSSEEVMQLCLPHTAWQLDSAMKLQIVSPNGESLALNEGQNQDIFWATRSVTLFSSFFFFEKKH